MKKICDLPLNTVIECYGKKLVVSSRVGDYVFCIGYNRTFKLKKTTLVKVLTKPLKLF